MAVVVVLPPPPQLIWAMPESKCFFYGCLSLPIAAHVKVNVTAAVEDVRLQVRVKGKKLGQVIGDSRLEGLFVGREYKEYNEENASCSKRLLNSGSHLGRHLSFFFVEYSKQMLSGRTCSYVAI